MSSEPKPAAAAATPSATSTAAAASPAIHQPTRPLTGSTLTLSFHAGEEGSSSNAAVLGCCHYMRQCLIRAPCCEDFFPCRLCHDDAPRPLQLDHSIDRRQIHEMVCMVCMREGRGTGAQPVAAQCQDC